MKVRCSFCEHESNGFCTKKAKRGNAIRIELNKPRSCDVYSESAGKVVTDYRKKEVHKKKLVELQKRNSIIHDLIKKAQEGRLVQNAPENTVPQITLASPQEDSDESL